MEVLVVGTGEGAVGPAVEALRAAGHRTWRCHDADRPAFPCHDLLQPGSCPLDVVPMDVALTVRSAGVREPAASEAGAACAARRNVPLVIAGELDGNPFAPWIDGVVGADDDLVGVCERTATAPIPELSEAAATALADCLAVHGHGSTASSAVVTRLDGALAVRLRADGEVDDATRSAAATRASAAVRAIDRHTGAVTVAFDR